jgi:DNA polymerase-3 subunit beta
MSPLNVRVTQQQLAEAVSWAAKRSATLTSMPIWAGLLIETIGDELVISATNYDVSGRATIPAAIEQEGRALVSARLLDRIVSALNKTTIKLTDDGNGHLVVATETGHFTLPLMPAEDFPPLPDLPPIIGEVDAAAWAAGVRRVAVAAGGREAAPHWLADILIETGDTLTLVGTDAYRLSTVELAWQPTLNEEPQQHRIQINAAMLAEHAKTLRGGIVTLHHDEDCGTLCLVSPGRRSSIRLSVADWNKTWRRLIPESTPVTASVPVAEFEATLKRAAALNDIPEASVRLQFSTDELCVMGEAVSNDSGVGTETLPIDFDGEPVTIRARVAYLRDALAQLGTERAEIGLTNGNRPAVIRQQDGTHLVMPIRLDAPSATAKRSAA